MATVFTYILVAPFHCAKTDTAICPILATSYVKLKHALDPHIVQRLHAQILQYLKQNRESPLINSLRGNESENEAVVDELLPWEGGTTRAELGLPFSVSYYPRVCVCMTLSSTRARIKWIGMLSLELLLLPTIAFASCTRMTCSDKIYFERSW